MMLSWFQRLFEHNSYPDVIRINALHGGDINLVYEVETNQVTYCIKVSKKEADSVIFSSEKKSLNFLADKAGVNVPQLYLTGVFEGFSFLMMTFIPQDKKNITPNYWKYLSKQVIQLHKETNHQFGLDFTTFIGPYSQDNSWKVDWSTFYVENRLEPQIKKAFDGALLERNHLRKMESFFEELPNIFPVEKASLLHGDLWSGNVLKSSDYRSFFIDPAIYYGHREMDLAMMKLFGGFDDHFFDHYSQNYPLEKGWENRIEFGQLYPLLVHLNLFGRSYLSSIDRIISNF